MLVIELLSRTKCFICGNTAETKSEIAKKNTKLDKNIILEHPLISRDTAPAQFIELKFEACIRFFFIGFFWLFLLFCTLVQKEPGSTRVFREEHARTKTSTGIYHDVLKVQGIPGLFLGG